MPSVKNKRSKSRNNKETSQEFSGAVVEKTQKRRPTETLVDTINVVKVEELQKEENGAQNHHQSESNELNANSVNEGSGAAGQDSFDFGNHNAEPQRIHIRFPGDTIVKRSFPRAFQLTEEIVNGWAAGGQFESLPIQNPFIRFAAKTGLRKAKEVETKVLESPVTEKVITKVFEAGLKAQNKIEEIRHKFNLKG